MKKYIAIPLFFVYFLAVSGVMIQQACCNMDSVNQKTATTASSHSCCSKMPTENAVTFNHQEKKNCCDHKTVVVKTIHDQLSEKAQQLLFSLQPGIYPSNNLVLTTALPSFQIKVSNLINGPPGIWQQIPLYKLHQRFTFYG